jgi:hypothetical protein
MTIQESVKINGARPTAIKMVDLFIRKQTGFFSSSDLPDSVTFMNGVDSVEDCLKAGDIENAKELAKETADEMLQEEGFGEFF